MSAVACRTQKEKNLFVISAILSTLFWIILVVSIVGIFYGAMIGFFLLVAHALFIAHVRGHAVKLSEEQLPDLYTKIVSACETLGVENVPDAYVMQAGGMLNAFATKFIGRNYVIIYADLIEACGEDEKAVDMIIGHEIGHLALGHLKWLMFLAPARIFPWLGAAYSRACEYSCDRCGMEVVQDLNAAARGLVVLAAGGKLAPQVNMKAFTAQMNENKGFWGSIYELNSTHPYLPKRIAALVNAKQPGSISIPGRNVFAYPLAPFLGVGGGGAASGIYVIAIIGIIAAIAIPQFAAYRAKAAQMHSQSSMPQVEQLEETMASPVEDLLNAGFDRARTYQAQNGAFPCNDQQLALPEFQQFAVERGWEYEINCDANYLAYFFPKNGQTHYMAVFLETGEMKEGVLTQE